MLRRRICLDRGLYLHHVLNFMHNSHRSLQATQEFAAVQNPDAEVAKTSSRSIQLPFSRPNRIRVATPRRELKALIVARATNLLAQLQSK